MCYRGLAHVIWGWLCSLHKAVSQSNTGPWLAGSLKEKTTVGLGHQDNLKKLKFCHRVEYTHAHTHTQLAQESEQLKQDPSRRESGYRPSCCFTPGQVNRSATRHMCCYVAAAFLISPPTHSNWEHTERKPWHMSSLARLKPG